MSEIIVIQIGQCGNNIGAKFWEALSAAFGIDNRTGIQRAGKHDDANTFFAPHGGRLRPRAFFVDSDPNGLDTVKNSPICRGEYFGEQFSTQFISGTNDYGKNWAKGYVRNNWGLTDATELIDQVLDSVRTDTMQCDDLQGFIIMHSLGGGCGGGLGSALVSRLRLEYGDKIIMAFSVLPSRHIKESAVEPYNAHLSMIRLSQDADMVFCLDNERLYEICHNDHGIEQPAYKDMNNVATNVLMKLTAPLAGLQQEGGKCLRMDEMAKRFIFERGVANSDDGDEFVPISRKQPVLMDAISMSRLKPEGMDIELFNENLEEMQNALRRIAEDFTVLFRVKRFLHWYMAEGLSEMDFTEAESFVSDLVLAYSDIQSDLCQ